MKIHGLRYSLFLLLKMFLFIHFSLTPPPVKPATRRTSRDTFALLQNYATSHIQQTAPQKPYIKQGKTTSSFYFKSFHLIPFPPFIFFLIHPRDIYNTSTFYLRISPLTLPSSVMCYSIFLFFPTFQFPLCEIILLLSN